MGLRCSGCGTVQFPPQGLCPDCGGSKPLWIPMSGRGKLLSASVGPHRMMGIEFLQATVKLQEGPLVSGMLLDDTFDLTKPAEITKYYGAGREVVAEVVKNPEGVEAVAFRVEKAKASETGDPRTERGESASSADKYRGRKRT